MKLRNWWVAIDVLPWHRHYIALQQDVVTPVVTRSRPSIPSQVSRSRFKGWSQGELDQLRLCPLVHMRTIHLWAFFDKPMQTPRVTKVQVMHYTILIHTLCNILRRPSVRGHLGVRTLPLHLQGPQHLSFEILRPACIADIHGCATRGLRRHPSRRGGTLQPALFRVVELPQRRGRRAVVRRFRRG